MIRPQSPSLRLQLLEDRATPAVFGEPWLDGRHLTLSFAPDGTLISGAGSSLGTAVSPLGSDTARLEILRAFQTWAANANLNIGLKFGEFPSPFAKTQGSEPSPANQPDRDGVC